jgi:hypothetical protein
VTINKKTSGSPDRGSIPLRDPVHEKFCIVVQSGIRPSAAAVQCGLGKSSGSYLFGRPEICARIEWLKKEAVRQVQETVVAHHAKPPEHGGIQRRRVVDITRNDIIMILADIARDAKVVASTRVNAALGLADIFLLRARSMRDLGQFIGWTDDEIEEYIRNGGNGLPERLRSFVDRSQVPVVGETANIPTNKAKKH